MLFSNQNKFPWLLLVVILCHYCVFSFFQAAPTTLKPKKKPIKVITASIKELPTPPINTIAQKESSPLPSPTIAPKKVKKSAPAPQKKIEKPKASPAPVVQKKQENPQQKKELLSLLETALSKTQTTSTLPTEQKSIALKSEAISTTIASFEEELVLYLQNQLTLPYPDKISLVLTLSAEGALLEVQIKECKEKENRSYLEKNLNKIVYPSFSSHFPGEKSHRFTLRLFSHGVIG